MIGPIRRSAVFEANMGKWPSQGSTALRLGVFLGAFGSFLGLGGFWGLGKLGPEDVCYI